MTLREHLTESMGSWVRVSVCALAALVAPAQGTTLRPFTVAEDIGLAHFDPDTCSVLPPIELSPDGRWVAVTAERGLLESDRVEDELRVYEISALKHFVSRSGPATPVPVLDLHEATYKEGPIISQLQWLPDSSGLAFLLAAAQGNKQLVIMDLKWSRPRALSRQGQDVGAFDVRDATHYAYAVPNWVPGAFRPSGKAGWIAWDGTGQSLPDLLLPKEMRERPGMNTRNVLWGADGGSPHLIKSGKSGQPVLFYGDWCRRAMTLSPDGNTLVANVPVSNVPRNWVKEFLPPAGHLADSPYARLVAGRQDLGNNWESDRIVSEYALIDLRTGVVTPVNGTPTGAAIGYSDVAGPAWSDDGRAILLPDAYLTPKQPNRFVGAPCAAIFYPAAAKMQCLEHLKLLFTLRGGPEPNFFEVTGMHFVGHGSDRAIMQYYRIDNRGQRQDWDIWDGATLFVRGSSGAWHAAGADASPAAHKQSVRVYIKQGLNDAPVVMAEDAPTRHSRAIWDPNPQIKHVDLGKASVYEWKEANGQVWTGGLYMPANYVAGRRYPLVIQTHGFSPEKFRASGVFPSAFAARELAANGIAVLQVSDCPSLQNPKSGPCEAAAFEAAERQLASHGLIDPDRVGIIGFSYTVYTVLYALATDRLRVAAASVTSGWSYGYWVYLTSVDDADNVYQRISDATVGDRPFGNGLQTWLKRAPDFNMQRVNAPVLVVSLGTDIQLLGMWEPYAALRLLDKPVDLLLLNSDEHVLSEPAVRMASQGGSVDWFRFWLQGHEDRSRAKAPQYRRWERLCEMQRAENPGRPTFCVPRARRSE